MLSNRLNVSVATKLETLTNQLFDPVDIAFHDDKGLLDGLRSSHNHAGFRIGVILPF